MTYGNNVRDDSQQLRDIQDIIAKLKDVNRKLALPIRVISMDQPVTPPLLEGAASQDAS
jgi:hypothetical protein